MREPSFSIIVPTFQRRESVVQTVRTLLGIDYHGDAEIVVVVDGSTDGTAAALTALPSGLPIRVIEQENRGQAGALNRGAAEAANDILLFLDDDMTAEPDILNHHARAFCEGADAVVGRFTEPRSFWPEVALEDLRHDEAISSPFEIFSGHLAVSAGIFKILGGFDETFTANGKYGFEDADLGYRLLQRYTVRRSATAITHHRKHITPGEYIRRGATCAEAELFFETKHPELHDQLITWTGRETASKRLRAILKHPQIAGVAARLVTYAVELAWRTPFLSNRGLRFACAAGYRLNYLFSVDRAHRRRADSTGPIEQPTVAG